MSHEPDPTALELHQLESVIRFIEQMGLSAQQDGLPRIAGRLVGHFIIHGGPLSLAQLAEALQVSRASISTNARLLTDLGILERIAKPGDRQDYYQLTRYPFTRLMEGYLRRMRAIEGIVTEAREAIPETAAPTHQRLQEMQRFYHEAITSTEDLLRRLAEEEN